MSAAIIGRRPGVEASMGELTLAQLGEQAAGGGARAQPPDPRRRRRGHDPAEVYELVATLACTARRLPQLLEQLSRWSVSEQRAGRLRIDAFSPDPDPVSAVAAVISDLTQASDCTRHAGRALDAGQQTLAHLGAPRAISGTGRERRGIAGVDALKPMGSAEAGAYQRLRVHLATLKLAAAAKALTGVLDADDLATLGI